MKQDIENQYDDDLTLGTEEYDDSYYTDADDLFDFSTSNESPISRLKSLVLSIDWEITDEVLLQFNEELIDLKGIWAGNSINLVYVQALEKISKYIYQNKANSHPNAIKLLLTLYYNLEKIVSSEDLSEAQKKEILLEDVKRFEALKRQISQKTKPSQGPQPIPRQPVEKLNKEVAEDKLLNLKAIVLGIDWEITDQDLNDLRKEVIRLEEEFANSKPKLILLQGIGTLGAYIKTKKSNAHADAFKVLHLFYESLEKIVKTAMNLEEEKAILFPAVAKFNEFKTLLGPTISPEAIEREEDDDEDEEFEESGSGEIAPALADVADEETIGFQAEEEAKSLGIESTEGVASHIDSFFGVNVSPVAEGGPIDGELLAKEEPFAAGFDDATVIPSIERDAALQGVDVGTDDEEEDAENYESGVAALADADEDAVIEWKESEDAAEEGVLAVEDKQAKLFASDEEIAKAADSLFPDAEDQSPTSEYSGVDREVALQGVNVETEADEDSDELSLPMEGEEIAPALVASEEESLFSAKTLENSVASGGIGEEIAGTLDDLFLEEDPIPTFPADQAFNDDFTNEINLKEAPEEVESFHKVEQLGLEEPAGQVETENLELPEADPQPVLAEAEVLPGNDAAFSNQEEDLDLFFTGSDLEQSSEESAAVDSLFESLEPTISGEEDLNVAEVEQQTELPLVQEGYPGETGEEVIDLAVDQRADDVSPAEEEMSVIEEEVAPVVEELPPGVEKINLAEEITPTEGALSLPEDEMAPIEEEGFLAEEEVSPAIEMSPVEEEISLAMDEPSEQVLTAESDFAEPLNPAEEPSFTAAMSPPAEEVSEEEEVVFELAEDSAEVAPLHAASVAPALEEEEFALADAVAEDLPPAYLETVEDEDALSFAAAPLSSETIGTGMSSDPLAGLRGCIESLGIELSDKIINGLFQEINTLRQKWSDRPLEKTFLQLLSTITQHIDRYRFEASSEAHNLLLSVYNALAARREDDMHYNQELLLLENLKVLEWQQGMLIRQTVQKGAQLTFAAPVRTEETEADSTVDVPQDFDQLLQEQKETAGQESVLSHASPGGESLAAELKQEIASLRMSLQKEIAELRSELKGV